MTLLHRPLSRVLLVLAIVSPAALAQDDGKPDIYFDKTKLPLSSAVLVERMEKHAAEMRAKASAAIDAKRTEVVDALKRELTAQQKAGNTEGAAAIAKQLEVWKLEDEARQKSEAWWAAEKERQKGADWKPMIKDPNSMERWTKVSVPQAIDCVDGVITMDTRVMALAVHPCGSQNVVVRGKMKMDIDRARKGAQQAGIGFQQGGEDEGGFACLFQSPQDQAVVYGGFAKGEQKAVAVKKTRIPATKFTDVQCALVKGALLVFMDGKQVADFEHPKLGTPPGIYLFAGNVTVHFKDLEMLSPNAAQIESLMDGKPIP